jgi:ferredoxin/predicted Rdx family selenoprotein
MSVIEKSRFVAFLEKHNQEMWNETLARLLPSTHEVDRMATRIWFAFWPLELNEALRDSLGSEEMARIMDLEGQWHLEKQLDASVGFLYGAKYWPSVKKAVLSHAERSEQPDGSSLGEQIRDVARKVAEQEGVEESVIVGITAVAFMMLQQVGMDELMKVADRPAEGGMYRRSADDVARRRKRKKEGGFIARLQGAGRTYKIVWDEKNRKAFKARHGEDLASAGARVDGDFRSMDYRRPQGPVPVECRIGSCGYCWVGVVEGKENLSELTDHEKKRLQYFGYDQVSDPGDSRPPVRLSCQVQCQGDVTIVIPPWNGELKRRLDKTRDKLGTV